MPRYTLFNSVLSSDLVLPELHSLPQESDLPETIRVRLCHNAPVAEEDIEWYDNPTDAEDAVDALYGKVAQGYVMRFAGLVDFVIKVDAQEILCHAVEECPSSTLRHLLLDQALPRLLGQRGHIVIHASAAGSGDRAIAFIGRSGWGKSTLAACLGNDDPGVLGDDALLLELDQKGHPTCTPAYRGARLWADSIAAIYQKPPDSIPVSHYSSKGRVAMSTRSQEHPSRIPLRALFILNDPQALPAQEIHITRLEGSQPLMALLQRCFLLNAQDMALSRQLWLAIGSVIRCGLPVYQLSYPRDLTSLPRLREAVLNHLSESADSHILAAR